ncbi:MAG: helix-turn-helix domain-containing protein [Candidatus Adiutrix sp.]|jgi:predicted XRE-type DNA-binding protein|nr:helix-turn-helix domain-containing protein [Candidatus Adiutrix sp.]
MSDIEKSAGNVYEDLGSEDSNEMLMKAQLAATIKGLIESNELTQIQAAEIIGLPQPKLSRLLNGHFRGVSVSKMMEAIVALGREVQIVIGPEKINSNIIGTQQRIEVIHS